MKYNEAVRYLMTLGRELASPSQARAAKFDLNNIRMLAAGMGDPQARFRSVHIAGTNGKGSTAAMMDAILRSAGYRTGLYTSPHLERINERIRVNGAEIGDTEFAEAFSRLHALIEKMLSTGELAAHPTFFECVTAMALDVFAREAVEFAVLEVGMGGRLDATNLVTPEVCAITQIAFDHENFLGHSIEQIAGEKAGIIKAGVPVVSAAENPEARTVIRRKALEVGAPLVEIDAEYRMEIVARADGFYEAMLSDPMGHERILLQPALPGRFQVRNAVTAVAAARILAAKGVARINDRAIEDGISRVHWPGRLERVQESPAVYFDGAHNPAGARELAAFWEENFAGRQIYLVYGAVRDKAVDEVAGILFPKAAKVFITAARQPRAISAEALAEMTEHLAASVEVIPEAEEALDRALAAAGPADAIFVTGSLYLVGDLRRWWHLRSAAARQN